MDKTIEKLAKEMLDGYDNSLNEEENKRLELIIERCMAENFSLNGWKLVDVPYEDEELIMMSFCNDKNNLDFCVYENDAVPYILTEGIYYPRNVIKKAIYTDTNIDYICRHIIRRNTDIKNLSKEILNSFCVLSEEEYEG
ncbi:hypothetical protein [Clostridioides sp. ZZV14-6044]|uniref:hypothetical protein n=1 Tax=unclassified Clostridioides TaxID=2635829 RepID=UPI001C1D8179|nr:hypothetical protein [Clostridioides sp. ZZV15-6597]MCC0743944.1 hypothetical protein [Clostridioides sp. ZZV14-6044]HBF5866238.1 hypothetical protein [Clostridioides difficile]